MDHRRGPRSLALHAPAESGAPPSRPAGGCGNPEISLSGNSEPSRAGCYQPVVKPERRSAGDPSRPNSRWWNPRGPVLPVGARPAIHPGQTAGDETHAAFGRRSIPAEPRRFRAAHRCASVGIHSVFLPHAPCQPGASPASALTSLTRLVSRAPHWPRRSRGFHHRLFTASLRAARRCASVEIHSGQFSRWGLLPHAPCQPGASPPPGELAALGAHPGSTTGCYRSRRPDS